jgi:hypothetical protein
MELAERIRREFGAQLPAAPVRESHADRDRRQEQTKFELETKVLPIVNEQRVAGREPALSEAEEDIVVELILSAMFLLPRLYGILAGEPLAEDVLVFPGQPVRVDRADGTKSYYPALARTAEELTQMIADVAATHHRPFSFEHPFVDVQLSPRLRFHGQGFDVVSRPAIFIRVHSDGTAPGPSPSVMRSRFRQRRPNCRGMTPTLCAPPFNNSSPTIHRAQDRTRRSAPPSITRWRRGSATCQPRSTTTANGPILGGIQSSARF